MMRESVITETRAHSFFPLWIRKRELRQHVPLGQRNYFYKSLYSSFSSCHSWGGGESSRSEHGELFCLEFSPDGTHLVAGMMENRFLMFDPLSRRLICTVPNAHTGCVTHIKFLDTQIFATGGGDGKVSLWDTRNLKSRLRTLLGHSDSIDNMEFSRKNEMLITSALNGITYIWDMKNWNQREACKKIFMSHDLQNLRLNPNETKMIISTASGHLLIVHELNLNTLVTDLQKFILQKFRFKYLYHNTTNFNMGNNLSRYVPRNRYRNRVEIVADFPNGRGNISALEIHPQGWSAFSRSKSENSRKEWTCVHDIQDREPFEGRTFSREESGVRAPPCSQRLERINGEQCGARGESSIGRASVRFCMRSSNDSGSELQDAALSLGSGVCERRSDPLEDTARVTNHPPRPFSVPSQPLKSTGLGSNAAATQVVNLSFPLRHSRVGQLNRRVHIRCPRLTHYIEEPYSSEWYIDGLGVSPDGRLVSSPSEDGFRLLAFSPECSEQVVSRCGTNPIRLYELSTHPGQSDMVVCTRFSPRHCLLVSGCADGNLTWYQPVV